MIARQQVAERMDSPGLPPAAHERALRGLRRINLVSRAVQPFLSRTLRLARQSAAGGPVRVLDVACGGGDVSIALASAARRMGVTIELTLFDQSDVALAHARALADREQHAVRTVRGDAVTEVPADGFDVVTCSLFLHHLNADQVVTTLSHMRRAARQLVLVSDLRRSRLGLLAAQIGCHLLSRSDIVRFDGPASVRGAWTIDEMRDLSTRAGLSNATIARQWPWRMFLEWGPHVR